MQKSLFYSFSLLTLLSFSSCAQENDPINNIVEESIKIQDPIETEPHRYGGWYCPDNLNGFPAVDISNWKNVPVVKGRMATKEEASDGRSLIHVDLEKYPNAKVLDIEFPKMAKLKSPYTKRDEWIIVIQGFEIDGDSIIGFRYLNGGNGSARYKEVDFIPEDKIETIPKNQFISFDVEINATQVDIWEVITQPQFTEALKPTFDPNNSFEEGWRETTNMNYLYPNTGILTNAFARLHYGSYYIQNDYDFLEYTEKFLLLEDEDAKFTTLKVTCGPFGANYDSQKAILKNWAQKVKELSEE